MSASATSGKKTPILGVVEEQAVPGQLLPLIIRSEDRNVDLLELASEHRRLIRERLALHGGVLFRGFPGITVDTFHELIVTLSGSPLEYQERSSPRHEVGNSIYTSTDYPPEQSIFLHNEQSYNVTWPLHIFFHCARAPRAGGATPLADCRRVYRRIPKNTREKLESQGYCYARHFGGTLGLSWREAFQTSQAAVVEEYCRANDIDFTWGEEDTLSTRQVRPVVRAHPETGEKTWFNHLTFFNVSNLGKETASALLSFGKDNLPNHTYYADGSDLEPAVLDELRAAYLAEQVRFPWRAGDILMLDNMLVAHGREPFTPPREVVVGMAVPTREAGQNGCATWDSTPEPED
jgi:alpha-ketoglutarate-dependent taurine dioxygenase